MWGTREVLERLERRVKDVEVLLKEFTDAMILDGRKWYGRLNKLENKVDTLELKERRITTLEQQVNDLMNENVDLISHLRAVEKKVSPKKKELKIYRDEERGGSVLKEKYGRIVDSGGDIVSVNVHWVKDNLRGEGVRDVGN